MAIFRSKVSYAANILSIFDKKTLIWLKSFHYKAFKTLLGFKDNISTDDLLKLTIGKSFEEYMKIEQQNTIGLMLNYTVKSKDIRRYSKIKEFCKYNQLEIPQFEYISGRYLHVK